MAFERFISCTVQPGDTITNTITKTGFATSLVLSATNGPSVNTGVNELRYGQTVNIDLHGYLSTAATPGTLTFTIDHANGNSGTTLTPLGTTGAFTPPASLSNAYWNFRGKAIYSTTGATGLATCSGVLTIQNSSNTAFVVGMIATGSGTTGMVSVNTSGFAINGVQASVQWSTASASNNITLGAGSTFERIA